MYYDYPLLWDWIEFALRWLHVITAIAWIGSSFYFIALDLGLRRPADLGPGVSGEEWQVHGGGFYHIQKYNVAPDRLPEHLIWFKWESYATWLSGAALMAVVYYLGADLYLIDPDKLDVLPVQAIAISAASIGVGWVLYDLLCKSKFGEDNTRLMIALYVILVVLAWGYMQIFSGRAAFLHLGALTATIMTANVFFIIIPNQKIVVADMKAGRTPDPKYGKIAKQRSTHNNYLTLPVLFLMLSNHYPLAFATEYAWMIAALVFLMGVTIRHFFNTMHAGGGMLWWTWGATAGLFAVAVWLSTAPNVHATAATLSPRAERLMDHPDFPLVADIVIGNCSYCHGSEVAWPGLAGAPKGVILETEFEIATQARGIYLQSAKSHAMPPPGAGWLSPEDRALLAEWYESSR
ncbi:MAG: urate hydroxylase PuuD [Pseudomonadota bacterium]